MITPCSLKYLWPSQKRVISSFLLPKKSNLSDPFQRISFALHEMGFLQYFTGLYRRKGLVTKPSQAMNLQDKLLRSVSLMHVLNVIYMLLVFSFVSTLCCITEYLFVHGQNPGEKMTIMSYSQKNSCV